MTDAAECRRGAGAAEPLAQSVGEQTQSTADELATASTAPDYSTKHHTVTDH